MISAELAKFLRWYLDEVKKPQPEEVVKIKGLCAVIACTQREMKIVWEMQEIFRREYADPTHPFGLVNYCTRRRDATQHLDPNRLAWVRRKLEEYDND